MFKRIIILVLLAHVFFLSNAQTDCLSSFSLITYGASQFQSNKLQNDYPAEFVNDFKEAYRPFGIGGGVCMEFYISLLVNKQIGFGGGYEYFNRQHRPNFYTSIKFIHPVYLNFKMGFMTNILDYRVPPPSYRGRDENNDYHDIYIDSDQELFFYLSGGSAKAIAKNLSIGAELRFGAFILPVEHNTDPNFIVIHYGFGGYDNYEFFPAVSLSVYFNFMLGKKLKRKSIKDYWNEYSNADKNKA